MLIWKGCLYSDACRSRRTAKGSRVPPSGRMGKVSAKKITRHLNNHTKQSRLSRLLQGRRVHQLVQCDVKWKLSHCRTTLRQIRYKILWWMTKFLQSALFWVCLDWQGFRKSGKLIIKLNLWPLNMTRISCTVRKSSAMTNNSRLSILPHRDSHLPALRNNQRINEWHLCIVWVCIHQGSSHLVDKTNA